MGRARRGGRRLLRTLAEIRRATRAVALWVWLRLVVRATQLADRALLMILVVVSRGRRRPLGRGRSPSGVCHVVTDLGTGGAQRQLTEYLRKTRTRGEGQGVRVIALFSHDDLVAVAEETGAAVEVLEATLARRRVTRMLGTAFPITSRILVLQQRLRSAAPRCCFTWLVHADICAAVAARWAGVPRVVSLVRALSSWEGWPEYRQVGIRRAERSALWLADVVVGNSQAVVDDLADRVGVERRRLRLVYNGIDAERLLGLPCSDVRLRLGLPSGVPVLLYVGRLSAEKNLPMLLRCCTTIARAGHPFSLVLVGDGRLAGSLRELCASSGLLDRVWFVGRTDEPQSYYRGADICLLSSRVEGLPNVLIEAQLFGLPVVTTSCGGAVEVVDDAKTGFVVGVDDEAGFVRATVELLKSESLRRRMGQCGHERARRLFGVERMAGELDALSEAPLL